MRGVGCEVLLGVQLCSEPQPAAHYSSVTRFRSGVAAVSCDLQPTAGVHRIGRLAASGRHHPRQLLVIAIRLLRTCRCASATARAFNASANWCGGSVGNSTGSDWGSLAAARHQRDGPALSAAAGQLLAAGAQGAVVAAAAAAPAAAAMGCLRWCACDSCKRKASPTAQQTLDAVLLLLVVVLCRQQCVTV